MEGIPFLTRVLEQTTPRLSKKANETASSFAGALQKAQDGQEAVQAREFLQEARLSPFSGLYMANMERAAKEKSDVEAAEKALEDQKSEPMQKAKEVNETQTATQTQPAQETQTTLETQAAQQQAALDMVTQQALAALNAGDNPLAGLLAVSGDGSLSQALLMVCMMLQNGDEGASEILPYLFMAMVSSKGQKELEATLASGDFSQDVKDTVHQALFSKEGSDAIPAASYKAVYPPIINTANQRNAANYRAVIDQFQVETNPRYTPNKNGKGDTYCNIFIWDVTRAMNAEIPHYIDRDTSAPAYYPDTTNARELNANATQDWLKQYGAQNGWIEVDAQTAQQYANAGRPAVTTWKNPSGHGHVQVVCPSQSGEYDPVQGVTVAQAGSRLRNYTHISEIYGKNRLSEISYFVHI